MQQSRRNEPDPRRKKTEDNLMDTTLPDQTPRREGGDDALAESSPVDSRSDEKVIVNEQRGDKTVNTPSQNAAHTSEGQGSDEDIVN
jgi:hypothetical protein